MHRILREPIQVYLSPEERAELDRVAATMGVSRSEVLRRGIAAVEKPLRYEGPLRTLADGVVTPPAIRPGSPPPSNPVAPLADLMAELEQDRRDR